MGTEKLVTFLSALPDTVGEEFKKYLVPGVFAVRSSFDSTAAERCYLGSLRLVLMGSRVVVTAALWEVVAFMATHEAKPATTTEACQFFRNMSEEKVGDSYIIASKTCTQSLMCQSV